MPALFDILLYLGAVLPRGEGGSDFRYPARRATFDIQFLTNFLGYGCWCMTYIVYLFSCYDQHHTIRTYVVI